MNIKKFLTTRLCLCNTICNPAPSVARLKPPLASSKRIYESGFDPQSFWQEFWFEVGLSSVIRNIISGPILVALMSSPIML